MGRPEIFRQPIPRDTVRRLAEESLKDRVKFVVDRRRRILGAGGELHSESKQALLADGSRPEDLWGGTYYLGAAPTARFVWTSMINSRPADGNPSQTITLPDLTALLRDIAEPFFDSFE